MGVSASGEAAGCNCSACDAHPHGHVVVEVEPFDSRGEGGKMEGEAGDPEQEPSEEPSGPESLEGSDRGVGHQRSLTKGSSHLEVDRELLRGISLQSSLQGFGRLWVTSPVDLPDDSARAGLWGRSRQVSKLNTFLSHTWHTPGSQKVRALLVQSGSYWFLLGWCVGGAALKIVETLGAAPSFFYDGRGPSMRIGGFLGSILGLLASPYLPQLCGSHQMCFLDVVSINQADPELMQRGIYGLGGFLAASAELRILWSPPYLSRLWCVFELAAFRKANPSGRIVLKPLFVETGMLYLILGINMAVLLDEVRLRVFADLPLEASWQLQALLFCVFTPVAFLLLHRLRRLCDEKRHLIDGMRTFELAKVGCRMARDKEFIYAGIREWYGSEEAFEQYVRGPLSDELVEPFSRLDFPTMYWLMVLTPIVGLHVDAWLHQLTNSIAIANDANAFAKFPVLVVACPLMFMNIMHLIVFLSDYFSSTTAGAIGYGKTLLICFLAIPTAFSAFQVATLMAESGPEADVVFCVTNLTISCLLWWCKLCC